MSQQQLADVLGVSLRTYQNYERGDRPVSKELLCGLIEHFRVDIRWLLTGQHAQSQMIDEILLKDIVARLRSPGSELRGLSIEHLLPYAVQIYNAVGSVWDEDTRRSFIESAASLAGSRFAAESTRNIVDALLAPDVRLPDEHRASLILEVVGPAVLHGAVELYDNDRLLDLIEALIASENLTPERRHELTSLRGSIKEARRDPHRP